MTGSSAGSQPRDENNQRGAADHQSNSPSLLMTGSQSNDPQHAQHAERDEAPRVPDVHL